MTSSVLTGLESLEARAQPLAFCDLTHDYTVITASSLQAKLLNQAYLHKTGYHSQHLPDIISLDQWVRNLHYRQKKPKKLLSGFHTRQLMRQIVEHNLADTSETFSPHTANQILKTMAENTDDADSFDNSDFQRCRDQFSTYLDKHHYVTHTDLLRQASHYTCLLSAEEKIVFSGFFSTTPALEKLWHSIPTAQLYRLTHHEKPSFKAARYETPQQAFDALGEWCKHVDHDHAALSLIVVDHQTDKEALCDRLNAILDPETALYPAYENLPVGTMLQKTISETPTFSALSSLLHFCYTPTFSSLAQLLLSPLSHISDVPLLAYHQLLTHCQHTSNTPITRQSWQSFLAERFPPVESKSPQSMISAVAQQVEHFLVFSACLTGHKSIPEWNHLLLTCLHDCHWPCAHVTAEESLILDKICQDLTQLPSHYAAHETMDFYDWLQVFTDYFQQASISIFSKKSPIMVLNWQDSVDIPCQHLILYAMDAESWPNPIGLPTEVNTMSAWHRLQTRMQTQTWTWTHIYSQLDHQNQPLLPSPLVPQDLWESPSTPPLPHPYCPSTSHLQPQTPTHYGPPITPSESVVSSTVLRTYNHCSSQGFIASRLGVSPPDMTLAGIAPWVIGQLIHSVLEKIIDSPSPISSCADHLLATISTCISHHSACKSLSSPHLSALKKHLLARITLWLDHHNDAHVDDPATIARHEVATKLQLGPVTVNLRADRIDTFAGNHARIIDYKTGKVSKSGWLGARLTEPQLPLYALSFPHVQAISYACLHPDQLGYAGLSAHDDHPLGINPPTARILPPGVDSWEDLLHYWRLSLTDTAHAYATGLLRKDPVHGTTTCSLCHFHSICRIYDQPPLEETI